MSALRHGVLLATIASRLWVACGRFAFPQESPASVPAIAVGERIEAAITPSDPIAHSPILDTPYTEGAIRGRAYRLSAPAGAMTIELRSYFFDGYLVVRDAGGEVLAENDDGGLRSHARVTLDLPAAVDLTIVAVALNGGTGRFELRAFAGSPAPMEETEHRDAEVEDARRELQARERDLDPEDRRVAQSLDSLAALLEASGRSEEARPLRERARIALAASADQTLVSALQLVMRGTMLIQQGDAAAAQPLLERALKIRERELGPAHADTFACRNYLASALCHQGNIERARSLFQRDVEIVASAFGPDSEQAMYSLNNLANLLVDEGKTEEARTLAERVLAIAEKTAGPDHPTTAVMLTNLAVILDDEGEDRRAQEADLRAISIYEKALGPDCVPLATTLANYGMLLMKGAQLEAAERSLRRAVEILERTAARDHPSTALAMNSLAQVLDREGRYTEALLLRDQAIASDGRILGPDHPDTLMMEENWIGSALDQKKWSEARAHAARRFENGSVHAWSQAGLASENNLRTYFGAQQRALALVLQTTPSDERSSDALYSDVLLTKAATFRLLRARRREVRSRLDPELRATLERLTAVRSEMSNLFSTTAPSEPGSQNSEVERLRREREALESTLARVVVARPECRSSTPAEVRAALPKDAVLVDFLEHATWDPAQWSDSGTFVRAGRWGASRFSAWISRAGVAAPAWVDLGPAAAIEKAITEYLDSVVGGVRGAAPAESSETASARARRVRELVWDPVAGPVGDAKRIFLCADGALGTLPFELIQGPSGQFLVEQRAFLRREDADAIARPLHERTKDGSDVPSRSLLVAGAIDYESGAKPGPQPVASSARRGGFGIAWNQLSLTGSEADGVVSRHRRRFPDAMHLLLMEGEPTEERLKAEMPKFEVIHLATHGYFLVQDGRQVADPDLEGAVRQSLEGRERRFLAGYWPELRCGVVCAGANRPEAGRDDGLLTGEEVGSLDLSKCDLVVLSACATALGKREAGEGLLSLTRSFRMAGARTVVSSLWSVPDDSTKQLMLGFYDRLWNRGESKLDALRGAQLEMLRKNRERNGDSRPGSWGGFILTGDPD